VTSGCVPPPSTSSTTTYPQHILIRLTLHFYIHTRLACCLRAAAYCSFLERSCLIYTRRVIHPSETAPIHPLRQQPPIHQHSSVTFATPRLTTHPHFDPAIVLVLLDSSASFSAFSSSSNLKTSDDKHQASINTDICFLILDPDHNPSYLYSLSNPGNSIEHLVKLLEAIAIKEYYIIKLKSGKIRQSKDNAYLCLTL